MQLSELPIHPRAPGTRRPPSKHCLHSGCTHMPAYGIEFINKKLYCVAHKPVDAVQVGSAFRCQVKGCLGYSWYRLPKSEKGYCELHRDREKNLRPVKRRACEAYGCEEMPRFGARVGAPARFSGAHKVDGAVDFYGASSAGIVDSISAKRAALAAKLNSEPAGVPGSNVTALPCTYPGR